MASFKWPPEGGGGGAGSGDVTGPGSSLQYSVALFADTSGEVITDGQSNGFVYIPTGDTTDGGGQIGLEFRGNQVAHSTGWKAIVAAGSGFTYIESFVAGTQYIAMGQNEVVFQNVNIRPDNAYVNSTSVGVKGTEFGSMYANGYLFGTPTAARALFMGPQRANNSGVVDTSGMGYDTNNQNEFYLKMFDAGLPGYLECFNIVTDNLQTTVSIPANTGNTSSKGTDLILKGGDKTAGTGNGGDTIISVGSTVGGNPGHFFIPAEAGAPTTTPTTQSGFIAMQWDSQNNKLYAFLNGSWKATIPLT